MGKKKRWVRLKRAIQKLKLINTPPQRGDGSIVSDKAWDVIGNKTPNDSTFVIKDTAVVARPK